LFRRLYWLYRRSFWSRFLHRRRCNLRRFLRRIVHLRSCFHSFRRCLYCCTLQAFQHTFLRDALLDLLRNTLHSRRRFCLLHFFHNGFHSFLRSPALLLSIGRWSRHLVAIGSQKYLPTLLDRNWSRSVGISQEDGYIGERTRRGGLWVEIEVEGKFRAEGWGEWAGHGPPSRGVINWCVIDKETGSFAGKDICMLRVQHVVFWISR
jgi:hypothetical protein